MKILLVFLFFILIYPISAQDIFFQKVKQPVKFSKGFGTKVIRGSIDDVIEKEFVVYAKRGQTLTVEYQADDESFFYIIPPIKREEDLGYANHEGKEILKIRDTGKYRLGINYPFKIASDKSLSNR